jgi:hypothetical protein
MRRSCVTGALQISKAKKLPMKNLHNPVCHFYFPENESCFWVRDVMHSRQLITSQQHQERVYTYLAIISKLRQNTLQL